MDDKLKRLIDGLVQRANSRLMENFRTDNIDDEKFKTGIANILTPWLRARKIEGLTQDEIEDAIDLMMPHDDLLARRARELLKEAWPRLVMQAYQEECDELVANGELVAEVDADGEIEYRRPDDG